MSELCFYTCVGLMLAMSFVIFCIVCAVGLIRYLMDLKASAGLSFEAQNEG